MTLTLEEVEHIARLARLRLTDEEKERYRQQLSAIWVSAAHRRGVARAATQPPRRARPGTVPTPDCAALRPDKPRPGLELAELLRNAPDTAEEQFRVPPILE
jgi:aspartyl-tRNA(Asn)/glutamyl-tRNA(Gln) amidotransferase subunit C